jgi:NitT/TauT family transport system permease protein
LLDPFLNALYAATHCNGSPDHLVRDRREIKVFIVFMSSFFPILVNTVSGVRNLDPDLLKAARAFCATDWQIFKTLAVPGSVPFHPDGHPPGSGAGAIGVVVGEMFGGSEGVGSLWPMAVDVSNRHGFRRRDHHCGFRMLLTFITEKLERRFPAGARNANVRLISTLPHRGRDVFDGFRQQQAILNRPG